MNEQRVGVAGDSPLVTAGVSPHPAIAAVVLADKRVVLDCRYLGLGGAGTVTELLLHELRSAPPPGAWVCWGDPERIEPLALPGAEIATATVSPMRLAGQRDVARVPRGDVVLYMHQIRPLRLGRSVTVIHDTIPLRHGGGRLKRHAKRAFLLAAAASSTRILTVSEFARRQIQRDLRVSRDRIDVTRFPVDLERARRIAALRDTVPPEPILLYVGRFARHKNLERLCRAFSESRFAADGGRLVLVGAWRGEIAPLAEFVRAESIDAVELRPACPGDELERLLAAATALIAPSLEEGYGLVPFEAASAGLPVAVSPTGAMTELPADVATMLDPYDVADIRRAIDEVTQRPVRPPRAVTTGNLREVVLESLAACFR
jgi:glycosyltransferase involved in cell wall biosynthesis